MNIVEILKAPFKGEFNNSKIKMKQSIIINIILACVFVVACIINIEVVTGGGRSILRGFGSLSFLSDIIDKMIVKSVIIIMLNSIAIIFVFSGIIYLITKLVLKINISYEEIVSTCTYANIIPTAIMLIAVLFSLFSIVLSISATIIQVLVLLILTYEGLSSLFISGKSKIMYSIAITYMLNTVLFLAANYLIVKIIIEYKMRSLFGGF